MAGTFTEKYKEFLPPDAEDVFVETGTYGGNGTARALELGFQEIHTIEVCTNTFNRLARERSQLCQNPKVHRYLASSRVALATIIPQFRDRNVVFWLDAHYQGLSQDERDSVSECPLRNELQAIADVRWGKPVVVCIDDFNMFVEGYWINGGNRDKFTPADWPGENQLRDIMHDWKSASDDGQLYFYR
jgi:hypothetical protein